MKIDSRTDATTSGLIPRYYREEVPHGTSDLILTYVPESEYLTYAEAQALALRRDRQAAEQLRLSVPTSRVALYDEQGKPLTNSDGYVCYGKTNDPLRRYPRFT